MVGIFIAFKDINYTKGILGSDWIGFKNFEFLFKSSDAFIITRNTILYNVVFIVVNTVLAVLIAIVLSEIIHKKAIQFYQSAILLPFLISMVIVSYLAYAFLSKDTGFINNSIINSFHQKQVDWYNFTTPWPYILVFINAWKGVGYLSIIYYASILGIDFTYYEAAALDGVTKWKSVIYITLPLIKPTIVTMVLLSVGRIFYADFGLFYQVPMNSGPLFPVTNVIDTYVYRALLQRSDIGMSSAAGAYQSIVGFLIVLAANFAVRKIDKDSALF